MTKVSKTKLIKPRGLEDIQKLRYFIVLAECSSYTEAATLLGISQSAVSQQMAELEKQTGASLFIHRSRQLTQAGKVLLKEAYILVARFDEALRKVQSAANGMIDQLRVGYWGGIEKKFLPQAIRDFCLTYPQVNFSLHQYNCGELNTALVRDEIDIGFTTNYGFDLFPELAAKTLFTDSMCIAMHRGHRLASENCIHIPNLSDEHFIIIDPKADNLWHNYTLQICAENGFIPQNFTLCNDLATVLLMVKSGRGIAILPGLVREVTNHGLCLIKIGPRSLNLDVMVAWKKNSINASVPVFVDKLESIKPLKSLRINTQQLKLPPDLSGLIVSRA
ncbi:MAG: gltC 6 [Firmicutes bacterium]|nr:gltC 6 [Bacillota bacterium]